MAIVLRTEFVIRAIHEIIAKFTCEFCNKENIVNTSIKEEETKIAEYWERQIVYKLNEEIEENLKNKVTNRARIKLEEYKTKASKGEYDFLGECRCDSCGKRQSWTTGAIKANSDMFFTGAIVGAIAGSPFVFGLMIYIYDKILHRQDEPKYLICLLGSVSIAIIACIIRNKIASTAVKEAESSTVRNTPVVDLGGELKPPVITNRAPIS